MTQYAGLSGYNIRLYGEPTCRIYVYQCNACGERMDKLQKISDPVLVDCPLCGQPALQKMVTAAGFRLKGSGWYETDFKTEGKRNLAGDQDAADKKADSKPTMRTAENPTARKPTIKPTIKPASRPVTAMTSPKLQSLKLITRPST